MNKKILTVGFLSHLISYTEDFWSLLEKKGTVKIENSGCILIFQTTTGNFLTGHVVGNEDREGTKESYKMARRNGLRCKKNKQATAFKSRNMVVSFFSNALTPAQNAALSLVLLTQLEHDGLSKNIFAEKMEEELNDVENFLNELIEFAEKNSQYIETRTMLRATKKYLLESTSEKA